MPAPPRAGFARLVGAVLAYALVTGVTGTAVALQLPERWTANAEVALTEPVLLHRLTNPFAAGPEPDAALQGLQRELVSRTRLVALAKGAGLVDQFSSMGTWPERAWRRGRAWVLGPLTEREQLDELVERLEQQVTVTVTGRRVHVAVQWDDRDIATRLAAAQVEALLRHRQEVDLTLLLGAADSMDERLAAVRAEADLRIHHLADEEARAEREGRAPVVRADEHAVVEARTREQQLLVRALENRLRLDVVRRAGPLRAHVIVPPEPPASQDPPSALARSAVLAIAALASSLTAAWLLRGGSRRARTPEQVGAALGLPVLAELRVPGQRAPAWLSSDLAAGLLLAAATGVAAGLSRGDPWWALSPVIAIALLRAPLKWPFLLLLFLAASVDDPTGRAYAGLWRSPLYDLGHDLFVNVAWFTGFELRLLVLGAAAGVRWFQGDRVAQAPAPRVLWWALLASAVAVAWLVGLGLVRGGDFRTALWQFRSLAMLPLVAGLALAVLELPRDLPKLFAVLFGASLVKSALGIYFLRAVAMPANAWPPHTTGHNDTMLLVVAVAVSLLLVWERPIRAHLLLALVWLPVLALALSYNDRRIAWVELGLCAAAVFAVSPLHRMKRFTVHLGVALLPLVLVYGVAGWSSRSGRFYAPVQKVRSLVAPLPGTLQESSNGERDIENYNLAMSWQGNPVLGQGFGHTFTEFSPSIDSRLTDFNRIGHNSVLWLLWIGGLSGFTLVWLYLGVTAFLLARALPRTQRPSERVALLASLCVLLAYLLQSFGDMGTQSIVLDFFVGTAVAVVGQLASRRGVLRVAAPARLAAPG